MVATSDVSEIEIPLHWTRVLKGKPFPWHKQLPRRSMRDQIGGPKVYRWTLQSSTEGALVYIGQTKDFDMRLREYRLGTTSSVDPEVRTVRSAMRRCVALTRPGKLSRRRLESSTYVVRLVPVWRARLQLM